MNEAELIRKYQEGSEFLANQDPVMKKVFDIVGPLEPIFQEDIFKSLVLKILSQQLSTKAAATIAGRMEAMIEAVYDPERMIGFSQEQYRAVGVSRQKFGYISDLCRAFIENRSFFEDLPSHENEEILEKLTQVKGIGVWTAQMFLMFTVGRIDVFAPDDVGLRNAIEKWYGVEERMKRKELDAFAERWKPYRTIASRYLWRSLHQEVLPKLD